MSPSFTTLGYSWMSRPTTTMIRGGGLGGSSSSSFLLSRSIDYLDTTRRSMTVLHYHQHQHCVPLPITTNNHDRRDNRLTNRHRYSPTSSVPNQQVGTRLYASSRNKDPEEGGGLFSQLGKVAKNFLPTSVFGSKEEKKQLARKKEVRDQVSGGLDNLLKDAPLGVRMIGKMVSPLISTMASTLADTMAEQQRTTEGIMDDARGYLFGDPAVRDLIGERIQLGVPFSQSSSTSSINGITQTRVELAMPIQGSRGSGTVRLLATQDGIAQLQLDALGRRVDVKLTKKASPSSTSFRSSSSSRINGDDNIIEAEVIDKKSK